MALSGIDDIDWVMDLIEQETNGIPDLPDNDEPDDFMTEPGINGEADT